MSRSSYLPISLITSWWVTAKIAVRFWCIVIFNFHVLAGLWWQSIYWYSWIIPKLTWINKIVTKFGRKYLRPSRVPEYSTFHCVRKLIKNFIELRILLFSRIFSIYSVKCPKVSNLKKCRSSNKHSSLRGKQLAVRPSQSGAHEAM